MPGLSSPFFVKVVLGAPDSGFSVLCLPLPLGLRTFVQWIEEIPKTQAQKVRALLFYCGGWGRLVMAWVSSMGSCGWERESLKFLMLFPMAPVPVPGTGGEDRPYGKWGTGAVCCLSLERQSLRETAFCPTPKQGMSPLGWFTWAFRQTASPDNGGRPYSYSEGVRINLRCRSLHDRSSKALWVSGKNQIRQFMSSEPPAFCGSMGPWKVSSMEPAPSWVSFKPCHVKSWPPVCLDWQLFRVVFVCTVGGIISQWAGETRGSGSEPWVLNLWQG